MSANDPPPPPPGAPPPGDAGGSAPAPGDEHALARYCSRAAIYDAELAAFEPVRRRAIEQLALRPGETVLDVGCGTGLSLAPLRAGVGDDGAVVGIEQSPGMFAKAQQRVAAHGWRNVELVCAPCQHAVIPVDAADAALFVFTHDIVRSAQALDNVIRHLKPGGRVVAAGLQWAPPWAWATNLMVLPAALYSVSSLAGLEAPWTLLAARLGMPRLETMFGGGVYVASGMTVPGAAAADDDEPAPAPTTRR